jgi:hypothetical protein
MLSKFKGFVVLIALGSVAVLGCGDDDTPTAPEKIPDTISIKSVTPSSGLIGDAPTDFVVVVEYVLASADSGELAIGFNSVQVDKFNMISAAKVLVAKSSGEHQFNVNVFTKDWGAAGDFKVYVNLAEHPHGPTWTPLATDTRVLTFQ